MTHCRWSIVHIGCLASNPYWGEASPARPHTCTTTLIQTRRRTVLVDPGLADSQRLAEALDARSGLIPEEIDTVFLTHFHPSHRKALSLFPKATWMMGQRELRSWDERESLDTTEANLLSRMVPIEDHSIPLIEPLPTPGHTAGSTSLMIETREGIIVIAGDAVLTFDHFEDRATSPSTEDTREAVRSINHIAKLADVIVPGHDNAFVV